MDGKVIFFNKKPPNSLRYRCQDLMFENKEQGGEILRLNERIKYLEAKLQANQGSSPLLQTQNNSFVSNNNLQFSNLAAFGQNNLDMSKMPNYWSDKKQPKISTPLAKRRPSGTSLTTPISSIGKDIQRYYEEEARFSIKDESREPPERDTNHPRRERSLLPEINTREKRIEDLRIGGSAQKDNRGPSLRIQHKKTKTGLFRDLNDESKSLTPTVNLSSLQKAKIDTPVKEKELPQTLLAQYKSPPQRKNYKDLNNSIL